MENVVAVRVCAKLAVVLIFPSQVNTARRRLDSAAIEDKGEREKSNRSNIFGNINSANCRFQPRPVLVYPLSTEFCICFLSFLFFFQSAEKTHLIPKKTNDLRTRQKKRKYRRCDFLYELHRRNRHHQLISLNLNISSSCISEGLNHYISIIQFILTRQLGYYIFIPRRVVFLLVLRAWFET